LRVGFIFEKTCDACVFSKGISDQKIKAESVPFFDQNYSKRLSRSDCDFQKHCILDFDLTFLHHGDEMVWSMCIHHTDSINVLIRKSKSFFILMNMNFGFP
jgi:hypothetical protein